MTARLPQVHSIGPATDEKNKTIPGHIDVRIVHAGLKDSPIETHRINVTDASRFLADLANAIVTVTR